MGGKSNAPSFISAMILIAVNIVAMVFCLSVFLLAIWMLASPNTLDYGIQTIGNPILKIFLNPAHMSVQAIVGFALTAVFLFFVAFMGLYGAIAKSPFLLFIYSMIVVLLLLLECSLFFYFSSSIVEKGLQDGDGHWSHGLRLAFQCCDKNITELINNEPVIIPWSCCGVHGAPDNCTFSQIRTKICSEEISNWLYKYQTAVYSTLTASHLILSICSLLRRSRMHPSLSRS